MENAFSAAFKENGDQGGYQLGFADYLCMKTIAAKRLELFGNRTGANANTIGFGHIKELVRNVGIRVDAVRLAELDALIEVLDCKKQEFIMELLVAGIEQAKQGLRDAGLGHKYDAAFDRNMAEAGFTIGPSPNEGYRALHYRGAPIISPAFAETDPTDSTESGDN